MTSSKRTGICHLGDIVESIKGGNVSCAMNVASRLVVPMATSKLSWGCLGRCKSTSVPSRVATGSRRLLYPFKYTIAEGVASPVCFRKMCVPLHVPAL